MSQKAVLDGSAPIRGGIPIAFPIFAVDVHPDYPDLVSQSWADTLRGIRL